MVDNDYKYLLYGPSMGLIEVFQFFIGFSVYVLMKVISLSIDILSKYFRDSLAVLTQRIYLVCFNSKIHTEFLIDIFTF